ncbi:hypothetical protein KP79_PYT03509 [Mizuhopecten yessoensis]|uniref:Uncharacterized protein n=1 Tax=Mizuhopecten yessoensis TaxID=6573 RepID=A0A210PDD5_MIZYE|nr:hypothetical protein KP79_PYT03509 [Mizuhopecten yessoensis]
MDNVRPRTQVSTVAVSLAGQDSPVKQTSMNVSSLSVKLDKRALTTLVATLVFPVSTLSARTTVPVFIRTLSLYVSVGPAGPAQTVLLPTSALITHAAITNDVRLFRMGIIVTMLMMSVVGCRARMAEYVIKTVTYLRANVQ